MSFVLIAYSVHVPPPFVSVLSVKHLHNLVCSLVFFSLVFVCTSVIFTSYFVYFVFLGELIFTWHIYYLHVLLVTYSVQKGLLNGLCWSKFPFYDVFPIFTSPWWAYFYIYNARMSGDLICWPTLSWWPILYIWKFLKAYSVYILPHV